MFQGCSISDRRLTLPTVPADSVAGAMAFPPAAKVVPPAMLACEAVQSVLVVLPLALLLLSLLLVLSRLLEPPIRNVPHAITAGAWRTTLLFMLLSWILLLIGSGSALLLSAFAVAVAVLALVSALIRVSRLLHASRIPI